MARFLVIVVFCIGFAAARPPVKDKETRHEVNPDYIVAFKDDFDLVESTSDVMKHIPTFKEIPRMKYVYDKVVYGIALQGVSSEAVNWLSKQEYVKYVEKSLTWSPDTLCAVTSPKPAYPYNSNKKNWGLDRITERSYSSSYTYSPGGYGSGATIYVVDSGIQSNHVEFMADGVSRVSSLYSVTCAASDPASGHGTAVAGVAAGNNLGTAKYAKLKDVQVACSSLTTINFVAGLNAIADDVSTGSKCVVVISYSSDTSQTSVSNALTALYNTGCVIVASAGNFASSSQTYPAGYSEVISVGAINANGKLPCYSNFGPSVDLYAPGSNIWAAFNQATSTNKVAKMTGTSYSAPFVAGVAAIHLANGISSSNVKSTIINDATTSPSITDLPSTSNSRILYV